MDTKTLVFRYRYDTETGLYYLQSRYYNSEWGRFINADSVIGVIGNLLSYNLFSYCQNDPVNETDSTGQIIDILADIGFIAWDVVDIYKSPKQRTNWAAFGADVACAFIPFATGGGRAVKIASKSTLNYLKGIEKIKGKFYASKKVIDGIGKIETKGVNFSNLKKVIMSSRKSTEGGISRVIKYSDRKGVKVIIHEVTNASGRIIHRDIDAIRIQSGQLINKLSK
jgi:RHS repeat-associated protein